MRTSKYLLYTIKEIPNNTHIISHQLMLRSGLIRKLASGLYIWLPNGLRVIKNIKKIIHHEMKKCHAIEMYFPTMQPDILWCQSNRIQEYGKELIKIYDRHNNRFILSPTNEEIMTDFIKKEIKSYKKLPIIIYQIQTKFRDEIRPRSGIMRSREFIMKDAYSFHASKKSLEQTYIKIHKTYKKIFQKMCLKFYSVQADSGVIGGKCSHEFQALSKNGEDKIIISNTSVKKYIYTKQQFNHNAIIKNCIEIGHTFQIGKKYSKIINARIQNIKGKQKFVHLGCYGIGITRLISAIIEQHHDNKGIIWPKHIAPFQVLIIPINFSVCNKIKEISEKLYKQFKQNNIQILLEDRNERIGTKFYDANLIGIPNIIIINNNTIKFHTIEYQTRKKIYNTKIIHINDIIQYIINKYKK
ncbi:proline--tRNA ligase [Buchnera aphidicola]|uniref:Proline--tRNA ligase n=1 Tax=Buchnera aphidicola (Stegophylla sp.) TaxID=2315800 RepID=A0A4D6YA87_9GAMM|nr:proline--tRNA ligase [Buchnera aphidicola (Stegophylla sp.)]QCI26339.1 proline--tRNA ligase [Buchnera aphidicola (Stegophylla sp.)]